MWWRKLGIQHDRIEPGKPQQNGRQERFHRTLAELVGTPEHDITRQQRAFDRIRREYNDERPHEALALKPPVSAYAPSEDRYPRKLLWLGDDDADRQQCIDRTGHIRWSRRRVFISTALAYEPLTFEQEGPNLDSPRWLVRWGGIVLGHLDDDHLDRGLIPLKRRR